MGFNCNIFEVYWDCDFELIINVIIWIVFIYFRVSLSNECQSRVRYIFSQCNQDCCLDQ